MKRILFVDDEPNVLSGLRRMLFAKRSEWDMDFAESGEQALKKLEDSEPFDAVVSDMRMPSMQGHELLQRIAERSPGTARIILSGHAEHESALRAAGVAHQFIAKPCDAALLTSVVQRVCDMRDRLDDATLADAISGLSSLPVLPESYRRINDELNQDEPSIERIAEIIGSDVAMATKVLQLVNSSYFSLPRQIDSIQHAATLLGIDTIRDLVVSTLIFNAFDPTKSGLDAEQLWRHGELTSQICALIAQDLKLRSITASELRIAGFVHDVGRLALAALRPDDYRRALENEAENGDLPERERAVFGADHAAVGAFVLGVWGLPETVVEATYFHNARSGFPAPEIAIVAIASRLVESAAEQSPDWNAAAEIEFAPPELKQEQWLDKAVEILTEPNASE